jgi:tripartite-type tricarboxylate transporter receptor subunit TctC
MKELTRRGLIVASAGGVVAGLPSVASGQGHNWPERPIRLIVPYPPGGSTDVLARLLGERLKDRLGGTWVVENRPGAGGNTGIDVVAKSAPDGYTIGSATVGHFSISQYLYSRMPFDSDRDLIPISLTWELPNVAVVPTQHVPARTIPEFIAWAKGRSGGYFYGSPGVGTSPHLCGALFATRTGLTATHVPFRGAAQTIPAMLGGDVQLAIDNLPSYVGAIAAGQFRVLAVTTPERWPTLPDVPTMAEAGVPDFVATSWAAFVAPSATPRAIVDRISEALRAIAADPAVQQRFETAGARPLGSTPEEVREKSQHERPIWKEMVQISGARLD